MGRTLVLTTCVLLAASAAIALLLLPSCSGPQSVSACQMGNGTWFHPANDPKCCAPTRNQFSCEPVVDGSAEAGQCPVMVGGVFVDDAGAGMSFPVGCSVNLTYCNSFYEGSPQTCQCSISPVRDSGPAWSCGI